MPVVSKFPFALAAALLQSIAAATLVRQPYVQDVRTDRAAILWTTLESGEGAVECSGGPGTAVRAAARMREFPSSVTEMGFAYYQYQADLSGLSAGVRYRCSLTLDGQPLAPLEDAELAFRTAARGPFTFLALGDSGTGSLEQRQIAKRMSEESPSLVLHTGDIVYPGGGYAEQQAFYFDVYWKIMLQTPFFPSPGNHDYDTRNAEPYLAAHSVPSEKVPAGGRGRYYSYDWGNVHFVSLDSNLSLAVAASGQGEMLEWLDRDLRESRSFWRVVYLHHAPFSGGPKETDAVGKLVRDYVAPILDRYDVPLMLNGHEHSYQRTFPIRAGVTRDTGEGVVYVTTGGGGAPLYNVILRPQVAVAESAHHFLRAEVDGPRMTVRAIRADGREIDRFTLAPPPRLAGDPLVNAASFTPEVASGGLVSILGRNLAAEELTPTGNGSPLPISLGGVTVELNGRPLSLLYVSGPQINALVPFDVHGPAALRVTARNGTVDAPVVVRDVAPAIFSVPIDGGHNPAVLQADGTLVSAKSPAVRGQRVSIYLTGLGRLDGTLPLEVRIGGAVVVPSFAGLVPASPGVYRVEVAIPLTISAGMQSLQIRISEAGSNTVLLAVQ